MGQDSKLPPGLPPPRITVPDRPLRKASTAVMPNEASQTHWSPKPPAPMPPPLHETSDDEP